MVLPVVLMTRHPLLGAVSLSRGTSLRELRRLPSTPRMRTLPVVVVALALLALQPSLVSSTKKVVHDLPDQDRDGVADMCVSSCRDRPLDFFPLFFSCPFSSSAAPQ
jgi:hypothetical protein